MDKVMDFLKGLSNWEIIGIFFLSLVILFFVIIPSFKQIANIIVKYLVFPVLMTFVLFFVVVAISDTYFGQNFWEQIQNFFSGSKSALNSVFIHYNGYNSFFGY